MAPELRPILRDLRESPTSTATVCATSCSTARTHAAKALLDTHGFPTQTYSGLHRQFGKHFVKTEKLPTKLAKYLGDAFDVRLLSDYDDDPNLTQEDAETTLGTARTFASEITTYLERTSR